MEAVGAERHARHLERVERERREANEIRAFLAIVWERAAMAGEELRDCGSPGAFG